MVLTLLHQHRLLTTEEVRDLLYPTRWGLRMAERRLALLAGWELIHWPNASASDSRYERMHRVMWLTPRGAWLVAQHHQLDPTRAIERATRAHRATVGGDHALDLVRFWVLLALEAAQWPDGGLHRWIGDDGMRARAQEAGRKATPDGWGRLLTPDGRAIGINLEWDRNKEWKPELEEKGRDYLEDKRGRFSVVFVAPTANRAKTITDCLRPSAGRHVQFLVATLDELAEHGPLGRIWHDVRGGDPVSLVDLDGQPRTPADRPEDCIGKDHWWERRPFAGEWR